MEKKIKAFLRQGMEKGTMLHFGTSLGAMYEHTNNSDIWAQDFGDR